MRTDFVLPQKKKKHIMSKSCKYEFLCMSYHDHKGVVYDFLKVVFFETICFYPSSASSQAARAARCSSAQDVALVWPGLAAQKVEWKELGKGK